VPDGKLQRGQFHEAPAGETRLLQGRCWLSGQLRGSGGPVEVIIEIAARFRGNAVERAEASISADAVARLRDARLRP
jgi:hypothetical protein